MREINPTAYDFNVDVGALDAALKAALPGKIIGISTYGPTRPVSIWLDDSATKDDETAALTIAAQGVAAAVAKPAPQPVDPLAALSARVDELELRLKALGG